MEKRRLGVGEEKEGMEVEVEEEKGGKDEEVGSWRKKEDEKRLGVGEEKRS